MFTTYATTTAAATAVDGDGDGDKKGFRKMKRSLAVCSTSSSTMKAFVFKFIQQTLSGV